MREGRSAPAAQLWMAPFCAPEIRPARFQAFDWWVTQLVNPPWVPAPSAQASMASEKLQPLSKTWLGAPESQPSMTTVALGSEPVRIGDALVGRVTSGGYGYTVERSIAFASLPPEHGVVGTAVEVEIFGEGVGGDVVAEPLVDPQGERVRG